jgi:N-dimethylarginine dimethylaminohydrolase
MDEAVHSVHPRGQSARYPNLPTRRTAKMITQPLLTDSDPARDPARVAAPSPSPRATQDPRPATSLLMAEPHGFDVIYEINPWMHVGVPIDRVAALAQWLALSTLYQDLGARVHLVEPAPDQPDLVYVANAGLVQGQRVYLSRFRHPQRRGEEALFADWFSRQGYEISQPPADLAFEGAAEVRFGEDFCFGGWGIRTDRRIHDWLAGELGLPVIDLELIDPRFYHLDTCLTALPGDLILYYPKAFSPAAQARVRRRAADLIELTDEEGLAFVANSILIDRTLILGWVNGRITDELGRRGFQVRTTPVDEFRKGGGSVACLTLPLAGPWTGAGGTAWSERSSSSSRTASSVG